MDANKEKIKIFCIGSNLESYECLKYLVLKGCTIDTLITLPAGQDKNVSDYYDLHDFCEQNGIEAIDTLNVNSESTVAKVKEAKPDYLFTLGWSQIFREDFISCFSQFIIGTHPSKLPYGRGRAPLPWTILEGLSASAVSFFKIDTGVDTGKIITQKHFEIPDRCYVSELYELVAEQLSMGFLEIYSDIISNKTISFSPQETDGVTVRGKRSPEDGLITFNKTVDEIDKLIRAVSHPYPGAYCYYKDQKIIFWEVALDEDGNYSGTPGQILKKDSKGVLVQFLDGNLWLRMPAFDDGTAVDLKVFRLGEKLGYNLQNEIYYLRKQLGKC